MKRLLPLGALAVAGALTLSAASAVAQDASPEAPEPSPAVASPAAESPAPEPVTESPDPGTGSEATTEPGTEPAMEDPSVEAPHPAHIHFGSCPEPGDVAFPLSHVSSELLVDGEPGVGEQVGSTMGDPAANEVQVSVTTVQATLADITGAEHAINVHLSDEEIQTYIACGDVAGSLILESGLAIRLDEQNDSGHHGIAWLAQADDASTAVYVFLVRDSASGDGPTAEEPMASPAAEEPMASPAAEEPVASPAAEEPMSSPAAGEPASPDPGAEEGVTPEESPAA